VREVICLDLPLGDEFVTRVRRAWDDGDAVFPLDQRLPGTARETQLATVAPTRIVDAGGERAHNGRPAEDGDALIVATSGTTGQPKAAVLTIEAVRASALASSARLGVGPDDCWFACLPPAHVGGFSVVARAIVTGAPLITAPRFDPAAYRDAAARGATLVSLVATALGRIDASLVRTIVLGGSRPPVDRPENCVATYGMTETGSGVVYDGRALDGVEIEIRDGIVHLRCPMLLRTYRDGSPGGSDMDPCGADGWFCTQDAGEMRDGGLVVHGRIGDVIVTGGEKVWPDEVEAVIATLPGVAEVCVAGVPDPEWGDAVHAWIVPTGECPGLAEVRDHVKSTLPAWCAPRAIRCIGSIPRTPLGKPIRSALVASN